MRLDRPNDLTLLSRDVGQGLARLSGLEGLARSLLVGTVPLLALDRLGSKDAVSEVYAAGAILTLLFTLNLGRIDAVIPRRWVMTTGIVLLFAAAILFTFSAPVSFTIAIGFRSAAASTFSLMLTLYVMDYIGKADLAGTESSRMVYNGIGWLIGPSLGIWLIDNVGEAAPFLLSATLSIGVLAYYWWLRLGHSEVVTEPKSITPSAVASIGRFFGQRYLRIAYAITFARATFWVAIFLYGPIYVVEAGLDDWVAGLLLSGTAGFLLLGPAIGRAASTLGTRLVVIGGFVLIAVSMLVLAALGDPRPVGVGAWAVAALGASAIDVVGNIPFMRMVKPRERVAMATVFTTWREASALISPLIGVVVLAATAPFWVYYVTIAALSVATIGLTTLLPRRL